ncbi:hypothetical protein V8E36_009596, partial [Tilletia maclaganii]
PAILEAYEREYLDWLHKNPKGTTALYGADQVKSLFPNTLQSWNLNRLDAVLYRMLGGFIPGITQLYLYFANYRTAFTWHKEDHDMASINYLHFGAPKCGGRSPPPPLSRDTKRFEAQWAKVCAKDAAECPKCVRHKICIGLPGWNTTISCPRIVQHAAEFVMTFPGAYHTGFNMGPNCAEAANFVDSNWIPKGLQTAVCRC